MAGGYTAVDLSQLPAPAVVEVISFEAIFAAMLADLRERHPDFSALVESDPAYKILEVAAYRETLIRQRVNEAAKATMLAYATGTDLDHIAALFGVVRLLLVPGDPEALPPVLPVYEADTDFRRRIQLSLEGFTTAGPSGAYEFHALSADADVLDAVAISPAPGDVLVSVLSRTGSGAASDELQATVLAALSAEDVRPLCDTVIVESAEVVTYSIAATLYCYSGPDRSLVIEAARAAVLAYAAAQHRIGRDVTLSGLYAALHQPGVQRAVLTAPTATIEISNTQASWCLGVTLTDGGIDV